MTIEKTILHCVLKHARNIRGRNLQYTLFYKQHFCKQRQAKIGKKLANSKQHPEAELVLFENYSHSSFTLSSKNNRTCSKK